MVEKMYEGFLMLFACALITHLLLWASKHVKKMKDKIVVQVENALERGELFVIAFIAFASVVREGVETVIFLNALGVEGNSWRI